MPPHKGPRRTPGPKKPPLTHFLCLPLVTPDSRPQLERSLPSFRDAVAIKDDGVNRGVAGEGDNGRAKVAATVPRVHPKAIRPIGTLHCTLGVMSLNQEALKRAVEVLKSIDIDALLAEAAKTISQATNTATTPSHTTSHGGLQNAPASFDQSGSQRLAQGRPTPLTVRLKGLVSMHPAHNTSILYSAPADSSGRLYPFCVELQKLFTANRLMVGDDRKLKLHATIINTIYVKGRRPPPKKGRADWQATKPELGRSAPPTQAEHREPMHTPDSAESRRGDQPARQDRSEGHGPNANAPLKIDATAILESFKDFIWAENVVLDRIAICEMGAKQILDDNGRVVREEYKEVASVPLPT